MIADYYMQFVSNDYYMFIAFIVAVIITIAVSCSIIIYNNSKQYDIIAKRMRMEIDNVELIRSLKEDNNDK